MVLAPTAVPLKVASCAAFFIEVTRDSAEIVAKCPYLIFGHDPGDNLSLLFPLIPVVRDVHRLLDRPGSKADHAFHAGHPG